MKERPILFSAPMVRAILEGRKTQTRRIVTTREPLQFIGGRGQESDPSLWGWFFDGPDHHGYMVLGRGHNERFDHGSISIPSPYGELGDRLWVREAFTHITGNGIRVHYRADGEPTDSDGRVLPTDPGCPRWRPSIFMRRQESRITLEVTQVRVQRLQEIDELDALAEGVEGQSVDGVLDGRPGEYIVGVARDEYAALWDRINGKRRRREYLQLGDPGYGLGGRHYRTVVDESASWAANPWVWAISFQRVS